MGYRFFLRLVLAIGFLGVGVGQNTVQAQAAKDGDKMVSAEEREAATRFFRTHAERVAARQHDRQVWLANRHVGIEFVQGKQGVHLSRLYGVAAGVDFLRDGAAGDLWQLALRPDKGATGQEVTVSSRAASVMSSRFEHQTLALRWQGLAVKGEANALDVEVSVTLSENDPLSGWRISVTNRSKTYGLWCVFFPMLELAPIRGKPETNFVAIGRSCGVVAKDPFHDANKYTLGFGTNSPCYWPGTYNMQFQALYDESGTGLYLATHDGEGHRKAYLLTPQATKQSLEYKVGHFPSNMGYPTEDFRMT